MYKYNGYDYFAPLASPKPTHLKISNRAIDIFKIDNGKLGVINLNNMIPTPLECVSELLPTIKDIKYKKLLENQITYINDKKTKLFSKINNFQKQYIKGYLDEKVKKRSCDFRLLEEVSKKYENC